MVTIAADQLLEELARARAEGTDVAATSLNVIAFVENDQRLLSLLLERIDSIAGKHATRSIVLSGSEDTAQHTVRDQLIQLGVASVGSIEIKSLVHDLMVPDVHSVLLWAGERLDDERFHHLSDLVDVVVMFSSAREQELEPLRQLVPLMHEAVAPKIRDISYMRLLAWQDMVAQFFDDEDLRSELGSIGLVEVCSGSPPEAYYFVGWLASRLRWEACSAAEFCNPEGGAIRFDFRKDGPPRRVQSVKLHSAHCTFGIAIDECSDDLVCLTVEGQKSRPHRCLPLHDVDMISLIERAIFEPGEGAIFAQTLAAVARLLEHVG